MIYIFYGNDRRKKKTAIDKVAIGQVITLLPREVSAQVISSYAEHVSLFGDTSTVLFEDALLEREEVFTKEILSSMEESKTVFIFSEENLLAPQIKKYKPFAKSLEEYKDKSGAPVKANPFMLADSFFRRDRLGTWLLYNRQIENGESPEAIAGMFFWRVKKALVNNENSKFKEEELKSIATRIMRDYHRAHNGECDLSIALESCILSVL
jgi:DNA polymerase III delta subunit